MNDEGVRQRLTCDQKKKGLDFSKIDFGVHQNHKPLGGESGAPLQDRTYLALAVVHLLAHFEDGLHAHRLLLQISDCGHHLALHKLATGARAEPATVGRRAHLRTQVYTRIHYF